MGRGRDEARLELLEPADVGEVAEGVDRPAEELDSGDRDPTLAPLGLERDDDLGMSRIRRRRDRNRIDRLLPATDRVGGGAADDIPGADGGDPLRRRVPEPDDAAPVQEEDPIGDVSENARCVRPLLDLRVQPSAIDGERDPPGDVFHEREVVRSIGLAAAGSSDRDSADRALTCAERNADQGARVDAPEEPTRLLTV